MRQTSIETYHQIRDEGLLSKMRFRAYELIYKYGPLTASEIEAKDKELFPSNRPNSFLHQRLSELRDIGVIQEVSERNCRITGRIAIEWDANNKLPSSLEKKKTKDQIIKELMKENENLKKIIQDLKTDSFPRQGILL